MVFIEKEKQFWFTIHVFIEIEQWKPVNSSTLAKLSYTVDTLWKLQLRLFFPYNENIRPFGWWL